MLPKPARWEPYRVRPPVHGLSLDPQTRCAHWASPLDVIAIKMRCCGAYYACRECHDALAGHPARVWAVEDFGELAVLCGVCGAELSVDQYLACDSRCTSCGAGFNPGCARHKHLYFATEPAS
jgi:uncharacterized CHY-type Zn-finger protein